MTALVVKVLSLIAERQTVAVGQTGRQARLVPYENIRHPVSFLLRVQEADGSFGDPNPVLHKGILVNSIIYMVKQTCNVNITTIKLITLIWIKYYLCMFNLEWSGPQSIYDSFHNSCTPPLPSFPGGSRQRWSGEIIKDLLCWITVSSHSMDVISIMTLW